MTSYLERALFVVASQDAGKSTALRSMFLDRRLGTGGIVPTGASAKKLASTYHLSNERKLFLRLTSPHEWGESLDDFIAKTRSNAPAGRWCFASPLQPNAAKNMPDVVQTVKAFVSALSPERVRVIFLSPDRHGRTLSPMGRSQDPVAALLKVPNVEVASIDARPRGKHGLMLADFFDFT